MSGITGDFAKLRAYAKKLADMGKAPDAIAKLASSPLEAEIASEFAAGVGPDGAAHAPRKDGGQAYATLSGAPAKVSARGTTIFARVTRKKARFMNRGRKASAKGGFMPARPIVPEESAPLPEKWEEIITRSAEQVFDDKAVG